MMFTPTMNKPPNSRSAWKSGIMLIARIVRKELPAIKEKGSAKRRSAFLLFHGSGFGEFSTISIE